MSQPLVRTGLAASVDSLVKRLIENKRYPKYQFERASEVFLAPFIEEWLSLKVKASLELVAMEFPLKKSEGFQSTNADYLFYSRLPRQQWWAVEMKTDTALIPIKQIESYSRATSNQGRMERLLADVDGIAKVSRKKLKYEALLDAVRDDPSRNLAAGLSVVFITPHREEPKEIVGRGFVWLSLLEMLETFQPTAHRELWEHVRGLRAAFPENKAA